jgi:hypothetical protein
VIIRGEERERRHCSNVKKKWAEISAIFIAVLLPIFFTFDQCLLGK